MMMMFSKVKINEADDEDTDGEDDDDVLQGEDQRIERRDAGVRC